MHKLNDIADDEIDTYLDPYPEYAGTFSSGKLPKKISNKVYIINLELDPNGSGTHWVMLSNINKARTEYFDSFGLNPNIPTYQFAMTSGKPLYYSNEDYQNVKSEACGYYCMYVAEQLIKGRKLEDIVKDFGADTVKNEKVLEDYFD